MSRYQKIPFQKWRLFVFSLKHAWCVGWTNDPRKKIVHEILSRVAAVAILAIDHNETDDMLQMIENLTLFSPEQQKELVLHLRKVFQA